MKIKTQEKRQSLRNEILTVFKESQATMDDVDYIWIWLTQKIENDKKHFLRHQMAQEVFRED